MAFLNETGLAKVWSAVKDAITSAISTKLDKANVVNNLTTTQSGYALDARMGKNLNELAGTKLDKANVVNNLTTTQSGYALDARMGKNLNDLLKEEQYNASSGYVDLKSYTSNNMYTFPSDGYVYVDSGGSAVAETHIWTAIRTSNNVNCAGINMHIQASYQTQSVFVRKGMKFFVNQVTATNNYGIVFVPLDE